MDTLPQFTDPDFQIERARQAARDRNGGALPKRVSRAELVQQHADDAGVCLNGPRGMRADGTYPAVPSRPKRSRRADLSGRVFDHLTVLERVEDHVTPAGKTHARYRCQCSCGNESFTLGHNLTSGRTTSCGHLRRLGVAERKPIVIAEMPGSTHAERQRAARALYAELERQRSGSA